MKTDDTIMRLAMLMPSIREKVETVLQAKGRSISWLARELGLSSPSLLYRWLDEEVKPRDGNVWSRIADILDVDEDDLKDPLKEMGYPKQDFRGSHLVDLLLDVIENPNTSEDNKKVARYTIHQMLKDR